MKYLLRLPRWLAGALLLFSVPALASQPAVAFDCTTVQYFRQKYSADELRTMALEHGYSERDIAKAEECMPKAVPLEHGKRSPTLPPVKTLKAPKVATPAPVVVPAPPPVVVVAPEPPASVAVPATPEQPRGEATASSSWLWTFITDLGLILLIGSALGIIVNRGTKLVTAYRAARAIATIAKA